jgi:hypothetical protein
VHQHKPSVHKVERSVRQGISNDVVPPHFQIRPFQSIEKSRVDVGDDHPAGRANTVAQPGGNRSTSASDLQAVPAAGDTAMLKVADGPRVKEFT